MSLKRFNIIIKILMLEFTIITTSLNYACEQSNPEALIMTLTWGVTFLFNKTPHHPDYSFLFETHPAGMVAISAPAFDLYTETPEHLMNPRIDLRLAFELEIVTAIALAGNGAILLLQEQGLQLGQLPYLSNSELYRASKSLWTSLDRLESNQPGSTLFNDQAFMTDESLHHRMAAIELAQALSQAIEIHGRAEEDDQPHTLQQILRNRIDVIRANINEGYGLMASGEFEILTTLTYYSEENRTRVDDEEKQKEGFSTCDLNDPTPQDQEEYSIHTYKIIIQRLLILQQKWIASETLNPGSSLTRILQDRVSLTLQEARNWLSYMLAREAPNPERSESRQPSDSSTASSSTIPASTVSATCDRIAHRLPENTGEGTPNGDPAYYHSFNLHCPICQGRCKKKFTNDSERDMDEEEEQETSLEVDGAEFVPPRYYSNVGSQHVENETAKSMDMDMDMDIDMDGGHILVMPDIGETDTTCKEPIEHSCQMDIDSEEATHNDPPGRLPFPCALQSDWPVQQTNTQYSAGPAGRIHLQPGWLVQQTNTQYSAGPAGRIHLQSGWFVQQTNTVCYQEVGYLIGLIEETLSEIKEVIEGFFNLDLHHYLGRHIKAEGLFNIYQALLPYEKGKEFNFKRSIKYAIFLFFISNEAIGNDIYRVLNDNRNRLFIENIESSFEILKLTWQHTIGKEQDISMEAYIYHYLHEAVRSDWLEKARFIIENFRCDILILRSTLDSSGGLNIFQMASKNFNLRTIKLIQNVIGRELFNSEIDRIVNPPCLFILIDNNDLPTLIFLAESGVNLNIRLQSNQNFTPLIYAIYQKKFDIVCYLLKNERVDLSITTTNNEGAADFLIKFVTGDFLEHFRQICPRLNLYLKEAFKKNRSGRKTTRPLHMRIPTVVHLYEGIINKVIKREDESYGNLNPPSIRKTLHDRPHVRSKTPLNQPQIQTTSHSCEVHHPVKKSMDCYWGRDAGHVINRTIVLEKYNFESTAFYSLLPKEIINRSKVIERFRQALLTTLQEKIGGLDSIKVIQLLSYLNERFSQDERGSLFSIVGGSVRNAISFALGDDSEYILDTDIDIQTSIPIDILQQAIKTYIIYHKNIEGIDINKLVFVKKDRLVTITGDDSQFHVDFYSSWLCTPICGRFCDFTINSSFVILMADDDFILVTRDYRSLMDIKNKKLRFNKNVFDIYNQVKANPACLLRFFYFIARGYEDCDSGRDIRNLLMWSAIRSSLAGVITPALDDIKFDDSEKEFVLSSQAYQDRSWHQLDATERHLYEINLLWLPLPYELTIWFINNRMKENPSSACLIGKICSGTYLSDNFLNDNTRFDSFLCLIKRIINSAGELTDHIKNPLKIRFDIPRHFKEFPVTTRRSRDNQVLCSTPKDILQSTCQFMDRQKYKSGDVLEKFIVSFNSFLKTAPCHHHYFDTMKLWEALIFSTLNKKNFYTEEVNHHTLKLLALYLSEKDLSTYPDCKQQSAHNTVEVIFSLFMIAFAELEEKKEYESIYAIHERWNRIEEEEVYENKHANLRTAKENTASTIKKYASVIMDYKRLLSKPLITSLDNLVSSYPDL